MVIAIDHVPFAEMRREHRAGFDLDGVRGVRRALLTPQGSVHERTPFIPSRAGVVRAALGELHEVTVQGAAERDVQHLASATHGEQRYAAPDSQPCVVELDVVEVRLAGKVVRVRLRAAVSPRLDVPAAREHQPVETFDQLDPILGSLVVGQKHRERPGGEERPPVPEPVVVAVVGEPLRDPDDRSRAHAQCPAGFSQPSSVAGCQSVPTVSEPSTHGPSLGWGNFACCTFSWMP